MKSRALQRGFTLVEMAIVLAIIGLILGAVSIGKDVQRNAEYTKIKQKFIDQWVVAYNTAYQRTGVPIGDSQTSPRLMVNGSNYAAAAGSAISGGNMSGATSPGPVCGAAVNAVAAVPAGTDANGNPTPAVAGTPGAPSLRAEMQRLGVRMPPGRAEGSEDRYVYLDSNGNPQEIQICFQWNPPSTASGAGNVMVISGLTPDLARSIDQMIDGKPDAQEGMFRMAGIANGTANTAGVEWVGNNNFAAGEAGAAAAGGTGLDENQVMTLTAHYKMNQ